ncbi:hypothetical protein Selin_1465 [Desulfurispirillum indicum S5]|uniref:DUF4214 domain-containing protein n=1 Tax=Desulfurispirillum indicum (strain ATCC BAA-1389 / DSM 22839 / S5) TaxID=653733 RepID=E6W6V6_DESIS|nr:conjugal transfer protein TraN [Desulfurispirillum indicum]ADU66199.1 hypothetical protein Selin_1465 [Desulfurispirillum indicum S5]
MKKLITLLLVLIPLVAIADMSPVCPDEYTYNPFDGTCEQIISTCAPACSVSEDENCSPQQACEPCPGHQWHTGHNQCAQRTTAPLSNFEPGDVFDGVVNLGDNICMPWGQFLQDDEDDIWAPTDNMRHCRDNVCPEDIDQCFRTTQFPHHCTGYSGQFQYMETDHVCDWTRNIQECTNGFTFNHSTRQCEQYLTQNRSCPQGQYTVNPETELCEEFLTAPYTCSVGSYNSTTGRCERLLTAAYTCSPGSTYNSSTKRCESTNTVASTCPAGSTCPPTPRTCPSGYTLSGTSCVRTTSSAPSCPSGYSFVGANNRCERFDNPAPTCPSTYNFVHANHRCERFRQAEPCGSGYFNAPHKARVMRVYRALFSRDPEASGLNYWFEVSRNTPSDAELVSAMLASASTQDRNRFHEKAANHPTYTTWSAQQTNAMALAMYHSIPAAGQCQRVITQNQCASGYTHIASDHLCQDQYELHGNTCRRILQMEGICPEGTRRNLTTRLCETITTTTPACATPGECDETDNYLPTTCPNHFWCAEFEEQPCPSSHPAFNQVTLQCERVVQTQPPTCSAGYSWNSSSLMCERTLTHTPYTSPGQNPSERCVLRIEQEPTCPPDHPYRIDDKCYSRWKCPFDPGNPSKPCRDIWNQGNPVCSEHDCLIVSETEEEYEDDEYIDDGQTDEYGQCLDQMFFFSGENVRCYRRGIRRLLTSCCTTRNPDGMTHAISGCNDREYRAFHRPTNQEPVTMIGRTVYPSQRKPGAVYLGKRCAVRWSGIGCVQSQEVYCVFSSLLARLIHEQGRLQLPARFDPDRPFGTTRAPNCRGFTPEEFTMIDISNIDLSEFYDWLLSTVPAEVDDIGNILIPETPPPTFHAPEASDVLERGFESLGVEQ